MVLDIYHKNFAAYLRNEDLQLALGPRSTGESNVEKKKLKFSAYDK